MYVYMTTHDVSTNFLHPKATVVTVDSYRKVMWLQQVDVMLLLKNQVPYSYNYHASKELTICIS